MSMQELEAKLNDVNSALESRDVRLLVGGDFKQGTVFRLVVGGDFEKEGNVFNRGADHLLQGAPVVVPFCLRNGYYSSPQIGLLVQGYDLLANPIRAFVASGPAVHNLQAIGNCEKDAINRAASKGKKLFRRFQFHVGNLNPESQVRFSCFDSQRDMYQNPIWIAEREKFERLYQENETFRNDVRALTKEVLERRYRTPATEATIEIARNYSLEELALVAASPRLLKADTICFAYHKRWDIFTKWADGHYDGQPHPEYGFVAAHVTPKPCTKYIMTLPEIERLSGAADPHEASSNYRNTSGATLVVKVVRPPYRAAGGNRDAGWSNDGVGQLRA